MSVAWLHLVVSIIIGIMFGVLIDIDHTGTTKAKFKAAFATREIECMEAGLRGVFHEKLVWLLSACAFTSYTIHLLMDKVIP